MEETNPERREPTMRAFVIDQFSEKGSVREVPTPEPQEGELLIRVRAAGLNAFDVAVVNGFAKDYMEHRFPLIPGLDFSGVIEAVGPGADGHSPGDEVYGIVQKPFIGAGTFAESVTAPAEGATLKPALLDHPGAAALPTAALTALSAIETIDPRDGQIVLVIGATGGVGSYATQLAANRGARVAAVTRGEHADYARSLGASDVIDYTAGDLVDLLRSRYPGGLDAVVDLHGDAALVTSVAQLVRPGGRVVSAAGAVDGAAIEKLGLKGGNVNRAGLERLSELTRLVEEGELRLPAIRAYPLDQAADALAEQASRHVRGKIVLEVG
jgi:NADPH:quinone reductase